MVKVIHLADDGTEMAAIEVDDFTIEVIYSGIAEMLREAAASNGPVAKCARCPRQSLQHERHWWRLRSRHDLRTESPCGRRLDQQVLHSFGSGTDGAQSQGGLIFDAEGNLYGMTTYGGINGLGIVFELSPTAGGSRTETVLHNFAGGADGANPFAGVIFDPAGNLYGVTYFGQTVFKMTEAGGSWTVNTLYSFDENETQGSGPWPTVTLDAAGNIYGTANMETPPTVRVPLLR